MLTKRIIPCLDIKDGRTVKGINFVDLKDAGDPVELAAVYSKSGADELVFLDITATVEGRRTFASLVEKIAQTIHIPFTVGGGISSIEDASRLLQAGADKIAVNSAAVLQPDLIRALADQFASQCVVVAIDAKRVADDYFVYTRGGRHKTKLRLQDWVKQVQDLGAGEILLTSMDADGVKAGFDCTMLQEIQADLHLPIIASGGAGKVEHFKEVFEQGVADAALAASVFHFQEISLAQLKNYLIEQKITVRPVD